MTFTTITAIQLRLWIPLFRNPVASVDPAVEDESRFRREQHLATALCHFRDRFPDLVETIGGGDRDRDRAGGD